MARIAALGVPDCWFSCGLTFELTPTVEAGAVSRDGDDSATGAGPAYSACRSGSGVERVVRRHRAVPVYLPAADSSMIFIIRGIRRCICA